MLISDSGVTQHARLIWWFMFKGRLLKQNIVKLAISKGNTCFYQKCDTEVQCTVLYVFINLRERIMSSCGQIQFSFTALQLCIVRAGNSWIGSFFWYFTTMFWKWIWKKTKQTKTGRMHQNRASGFVCQCFHQNNHPRLRSLISLKGNREGGFLCCYMIWNQATLYCSARTLG